MSIREVGNAIATRLTSDSLASPIASIAGAVVTLSSGGASWSKGMQLNMNGDNLYHCATVTLVSGNDLTLDETPGSAPGVGDTVRGGWVQWVRPAVGVEELIYHEPLVGADPAKVFEDPDVPPYCQARLRFALAPRGSQHREPADFDLRFLGRDLEFIEGALDRAERLLNGQMAALLPAAHDTWELHVGSSRPVRSESNLIGLPEYVLPITAVVAVALGV